MKHHLHWLAVSLLLPLAALSLHCTRPQACVPGQSVACTGPAGCSGGQVCNAAGDGYEACNCSGGGGDGGTRLPDGGMGWPELRIEVVTTVCNATVDPLVGVTQLKVRVRGDGISGPLEGDVPLSGSHQLNLMVTPGKARVVEVRGYGADPLGGMSVRSAGRSLPFDVAPGAAAIPVTLFLRKVNSWTAPSLASSPSTCVRLSMPRSGHTATALKSGKVFIAGGFNLIQGSTTKASLSDTELYNPATNGFEVAPRMALSNGTVLLPKAFHTATAINQSSQVLLWGGETYTNNVIDASSVILVFDEDAQAYGAVPARTNPPAIPRTQHAAAAEPSGRVLLVGGMTRTGNSQTEVPDVEFFDPATNATGVVMGVSAPRRAVAAVPAGDFVVVAGGLQGAAFANEILFFRWNGTSMVRQTFGTPPQLSVSPRGYAAAGTLRDGGQVVLAGGLGPTGVLSSSEVFDVSTRAGSPGPSVGSSGPNGRSVPCAAALPDGRLLIIGGQTLEAVTDQPRSDGSTLVLSAGPGGSVVGTAGADLPVPRYDHTCTGLANGTVLVVGGEQRTSAQVITQLQDAWIYQPVPLD